MKRLLFFAALLLGVLGFLFWTGQPETPAPPPETASESADAEPSRVKIPQPSLPTRTSTEDPADDTPEVEEAPPHGPSLRHRHTRRGPESDGHHGHTAQAVPPPRASGHDSGGHLRDDQEHHS